LRILLLELKTALFPKEKRLYFLSQTLTGRFGKVLVKEKFLESIKEQGEVGKKELKAVIGYDDRLPVMTDVEVISKPSLRVYYPAKRILEIGKRGRRKVVVSTSQGVMTALEASKKGLGGEILFAIW